MSLFQGEAWPLNLARDKNILVIGSGYTQEAAAEKVKSSGGNPILISPAEKGNSSSQYDSIKGHLLNVEGPSGHFTVFIESNGKIRTIKAGGLVLAADSVSEIEEELSHLGDLSADSDSVAVFAGFDDHLQPDQFKSVVIKAMELAEKETKVFVFCDHAKVAMTDLDEEYRNARRAGAVFTRLLKKPFYEKKNKKFKISYDDPILDTKVTLTADQIAVQRKPHVDEYIVSAAHALKLPLAQDGYPVLDNLLFPTPLTARAGVWAVGGARGVSSSSLSSDIELLTDQLTDWFAADNNDNIATRLAADRSECATCLTCFRACPVKAIAWDLGPIVIESVCLRCGQCAAVCPAEIIKPLWEEESRLNSLLEKDGHESLLLYCGRIPDENVAELPDKIEKLKLNCAGRINNEILLRLFEKGWQKIILVSCHYDNCRSQTGTERAALMVEEVKEDMIKLGIDPDCLLHEHVAPNQKNKLNQLLKGFLEV